MKSLFACLALSGSILATLVSTSRAEQVVFSEIMYHPPVGKPEFIEMLNLTVTPLDMALWKLSAGVAFTFPDFNAGNSQAHLLKPYERIVVSAVDEAATRAAYPGIPVGVRVFGPWTGSLDNAGERVTLADLNAVHVCTVNYNNAGHWPRAADGAGHSLVLADETRGIDDWRVWKASVQRFGSAGLAEPIVAAPALTLSEAHFDALNTVDWIELRNRTATSASATGLFLASKADLTNKVALSGSVAAGGYASYTVSFPASGSGDLTLYLADSSDHVLEAVKLQRVAGRDSMQRFPATSTEWYSSVTSTQGVVNNPTLTTSVVINEIMLDTPTGQRDAEFLELHNRSGSPVSLAGWKLDDAVKFTFPAGTSLPAGGYVVVGANAAWLNANYAGLAALGNWSGSLKNGGDNIRLVDANGNLVDEVDYRIGGEWPSLAGGNGSSLELTHPNADNAYGGAWADSDESAKGAWKTFTINGGTYRDLTKGSTNDDEILLWLVGDAHLVLRNLVLRPTSGGANLFVNPTVTTLNNNNIDGWQSRGTHWASYHDAEGVHIVADGHGDNKCNHMEKDAPGMTVNTAYTMTFEARWVYGKPRLVAQSWDTSWGGTVLVPVPTNLGTPGAVNSRLAPAAPPLVTGGVHSPAVPNTTQTVTVTARVASSISLASVNLIHRLDNINAAAAWSSTAMNDGGTAGDAVAGDGIYTGQVNPASFGGYNVNGAVIEFYVRATATNGQTGDFPRGGAATPGLWVVDTQSVATDLRRMRVVVSNYWLDALNQDSATGGHTVKFNFKYPRFSNRYFPCTFIHNDGTVFYGAAVRKTGSPFTRSTGNSLDRARVTLPGDRPFRGQDRIYWDNDAAGVSMHHNRIHRYWLYLLGVPGNENEICRVTRNNTGYAVRESSEVFGKDMLSRIWENGNDGLFYELDDKFWIADNGATRLANENGSFDYDRPDSPGAENPVSYHNNFVPKSREWEYDFSGLIEWFRQIEQVGAALTPEQIERMVDVKAMAAYAAVRGYTADWDNITMSRGKNGFIYQKATDHRWMFIQWDSDGAFQTGRINDPVIGSLTNVGTFYGLPYVRRYVNYYLAQMIGPLSSSGPRLSAWVVAEEASSPSFTITPAYGNWPTTLATSGTAQTRHTVVQNFIGATSLNAAFALTSPPASTGGVTIDINGTAPAAAFRVECVGHPEAVLTWTGTVNANVSPWRLSGIILAAGANALTFRMFDAGGAQVGADVTHVVTKTGNAPPVVRLSSSPGSQNAALGQTVTVDAGASYDPEAAGALGLVWTVTPSTGFVVTATTATTRSFAFGTPGTYRVTVQATDVAAQSAAGSLDISVYNTSDWDSFGSPLLGAGYSLQNLKLRDNNSPDTWYSLTETSGHLVMQSLDSVARPLTNTTPLFPRVTRALPPSAEFLMQTKLLPENRQFGNFMTGLFMETMESGVVTRYAFGLNGGSTLAVFRASGAAGTFSSVGSVTYAGEEITVRVLRAGTSLKFQRRLNGLWSDVHARTLPAGSTAVNGGLFTSTTTAQNIRVAFDYLLVGDTGNTSGVVNNLRVTEIMYQPAPGGVEYVELTNTGPQALQLQGVYFETGRPFTLPPFGAFTLQPGAFVVVTQNLALFQSLYGNMIPVIGEYTGALDNAGERIVLRDASANLIQDFTYGSSAPWPTSPKGTGLSLEILLETGDYGTATNWRAGVETGGSPGSRGAGFDTDGDGQSDRAETMLGTNPANADSLFRVTQNSRDLAGNVTLEWPTVTGVTYRVEASATLAPNGWQPLQSFTGTGSPIPFTDTGAASQNRRFHRVVAVLP